MVSLVDVGSLASYVTELCVNRRSESRSLDFKRDLPEKTEKGRFDFAKDVAAFANAEGGRLVFGVEEEDGLAARLRLLAVEGADEAKRRMGQILDAAIEPRVFGVSFSSVDIEGGYILVVDVPRSTNGPHRVGLSGNGRFMTREGTYTRDMTYGELRDSFSAFNDLRERASNIREFAIDRVLKERTWRPLLEGPTCVTQLLPFTAMNEVQFIDVSRAYSMLERFMFANWGGASSAFNLDGVAFYPGGESDRLHSYNQLYRNGICEAFSYAGVFYSDEDIIPALGVSFSIREAVAKFCIGLRELGRTGPAILMVTLVNVEGHKFETGQNRFWRRTPRADRDILPLPQTIIDDIAAPVDLDEVLRPTLDILWQSFGLAACTYYENGVWSATDG